jgi:carbon storage regulator CsrA
MLVIRCRAGETVSIGEDTQLSILSVEAGRVKLGFTAPQHVAVSRNCGELTTVSNRMAMQGLNPEGLEALASRFASEPVELAACVVAVDVRKNSSKLSKQNAAAAEKSSDG